MMPRQYFPSGALSRFRVLARAIAAVRNEQVVCRPPSIDIPKPVEIKSGCDVPFGLITRRVNRERGATYSVKAAAAPATVGGKPSPVLPLADRVFRWEGGRGT